MDTIHGDTVVGEGVNGTLNGLASATQDAKIGKAINIHTNSKNDHIYFGINADTCLGNMTLCPDYEGVRTLTVALWIKVMIREQRACIFVNNGGIRLYIIRNTNDVTVHLNCFDKKYQVENVVVPNPEGWNYYIVSCDYHGNYTVFVNGYQYYHDIIQSIISTGDSGKVYLGMPFIAQNSVWFLDQLK